VSSYADYVSKLAEYLEKGERATPPVGMIGATIDGIKSIPQVSSDIGFLARSSFTFFSSALIGYFGVPGLMNPYDSNAASTAALLIPLSGGFGSAIVSNMNRFLGIAGGSVLGSLLHATAVPCESWAPVTGFLVTFIFLLMTGFTSYKSPSYGFIGTLGAVSSLGQLFRKCGSDPNNKMSEFTNMQTQMIAIFLACCGDLLIGNQSASTLACNSYKNLVKNILHSLNEVFHPMKDLDTDRRGFRSTLMAQYADAQLMGHEASIEPRVHRLPWNAPFYENLVEESQQDTTNAGLLRFTAVECHRNPKLKPLLEAITSCPAAKASVAEAVARGDLSVELAVTIMSKDTASMLLAPLQVCKAISEGMPKPLQMDSALILKEINEAIQKGNCSAEKASEDGHCLAGTILFVIKSLVKSIGKSESLCYSSPEMKK